MPTVNFHASFDFDHNFENLLKGADPANADGSSKFWNMSGTNYDLRLIGDFDHDSSTGTIKGFEIRDGGTDDVLVSTPTPYSFALDLATFLGKLAASTYQAA